MVKRGFTFSNAPALRMYLAAACASVLISTAYGRGYTPNIIVMLADDFGYGSINAYGAKEKYVETPNLNDLTKGGIKFTQADTSGSVCTPTRYGIVTGEYSWRSRLKSGVVNNNDGLIIDPDKETVASFLQKQGYKTAIVGKWHLGYTSGRFENLLGKIQPGPNDIGFDYQFAVPNNLDDLHKVWIENDHIYGLRSDKIEPYPVSSYGGNYIGYDAPQRVCKEVMDELTRRSIAWIDGLPEDQPFFLYHAFPAVHNPISPSDTMKGKSGCGEYGDFIQDIDLEVGHLITALKERGLYENTLIIFTSDNGGDLPKKRESPQRIAYDKGFEFNGENRGDKHLIYNGGSHVPFIVSWPGKIKPGGKCSALICTVDIFGTLAHLVTGEETDPMKAAPDSVSFLTLMANPTDKSIRSSFISRDVKGRKYIRFGDWKYVDNVFPAGPNDPETVTQGKPELYNIDKDPMEEKDLFRSNPEKAEEGMKLLDQMTKTPSSRKPSTAR